MVWLTVYPLQRMYSGYFFIFHFGLDDGTSHVLAICFVLVQVILLLKMGSVIRYPSCLHVICWWILSMLLRPVFDYILFIIVFPVQGPAATLGFGT